MDEFPRLFLLSNDKNGVVSVFFERRTEDGGWNLGFRRSLLAWEEVEAYRLFNLLSTAPTLCSTRLDELHWCADPSILFYVSLVYKWTESSMGPAIPVTASIWNNFAPPKVQFFGWLAWLGLLRLKPFFSSIELESSQEVQTLAVCFAIMRLKQRNIFCFSAPLCGCFGLTLYTGGDCSGCCQVQCKVYCNDGLDVECRSWRRKSGWLYLWPLSDPHGSIEMTVFLTVLNQTWKLCVN